MKASGLPADTEVELIFNTMRGSRVSGDGFGEEKTSLGKVKTDKHGAFEHHFNIPDDLGGIPHRIDLTIGDEVYTKPICAFCLPS